MRDCQTDQDPIGSHPGISSNHNKNKQHKRQQTDKEEMRIKGTKGHQETTDFTKYIKTK